MWLSVHCVLGVHSGVHWGVQPVHWGVHLGVQLPSNMAEEHRQLLRDLFEWLHCGCMVKCTLGVHWGVQLVRWGVHFGVQLVRWDVHLGVQLPSNMAEEHRQLLKDLFECLHCGCVVKCTLGCTLGCTAAIKHGGGTSPVVEGLV